MGFAESVMEAHAVYPEENVLNHVFPFYECENGNFAFFGRITKVECRDHWIVTPLKATVIDDYGETSSYKVNGETAGKKYLRTSHSGRRLYIDKPFETDLKLSAAYKRLFDEPLFEADFKNVVNDMDNVIVSKKIFLDGLL